MPAIADLRCRVFGANVPPSATLYANPMRAWDGPASADERSYRFAEWLVVEVELSSGEVGLGNAGLAPRLAAEFADAYLRPQVVGAAAESLEATWQHMYRSTVQIGRRGLGMAAISAVDIAMWDAWAKHLGVPVHALLGGRKQRSFPVYASRLYACDDLDVLAAEARSYVDMGFTAVKQRFAFGPADGVVGMRRNEALVAAVRDAVGPDVEVMADAFMGWDLDYALRMVRRLERYDLRWVEEPLLPDEIGGYSALRARSPIPIAAGEHEQTLAGFQQLISAGAVDVIQFDTNRVGGLTPARKICALAEAAGIPVVPHAGQMHNYHLVATQPACPMAEYFPPGPVDVGNELPHRLFAGEPQAVGGRIELPDTPGLGLTLEVRDPLVELDRGSR